MLFNMFIFSNVILFEFSILKLF